MEKAELAVRIATGVFVLAVNVFIVWKYYGAELREWWRNTVVAWWSAYQDRRKWDRVWEIKVAQDG